jgi:hypothetical protein
MQVKKSEQYIPANFQVTELGQSVVTPDNKAALVSYYTTPVTLGRKQSYVVFVLDNVLQGKVDKYRWQVKNSDEVTQEGIWEFTPADEGELLLNVTLLDSSNASLVTMSLSQTVVPPSQELENLIAQDDTVHPVAGDPDTSREVINDFLTLLHAVAPTASAEDLNRLLFAISYVEALDQPQSARDKLLKDLRTSVNKDQTASFFQQASSGGGVCRIRPEVLGMILTSGGSPVIAWEELPADAAERKTSLTKIQATLTGLPADRHIDVDMYNILRFPLANLKVSKQIFDSMLGRYFSGSDYNTVLHDNIKAAQLINQFKTGPFAMTPDLKSTGYSDRVIGRMVANLWFLLGSAPTSVPIAITPGTPPALFGVPEHVPEITYISTMGTAGFLNDAVAYHTTYGLNPQRFNSLEDLINILRTGSHIGRLRIVAHVGLNTTSSEANMNVAFFNGGEPILTREMLEGFAISDEAGLRSIIDKTGFKNPTGPVFNTLIPEILQVLRVIKPEVLTPFGLESSDTLSGDLQLYFFVCSDLLYVSLSAVSAQYATITFNNNNLTSIQRGNLNASLGIIANNIKSRLVSTTITEDNLNNLKSAITGLSFFLVQSTTPNFSSMVPAIITALLSSNPGVLSPFGLTDSSPVPTGNVELFFLICSDILFASLVFANPANGSITIGGNNLTSSQRSDLNASLNIIADAIQGRIAGTTTITALQLSNLRTAIKKLTMDELGSNNLGGRGYGNFGSFTLTGFDAFRILGEANAAIGRGFRQHLDSVKLRFDQNSWIDIRGCRIGQDRDYLRALQQFFGRLDALPSVSGPTWYQSFPSAGSIPRTTEAEIDDLWNHGFTGAAATHTTQVIQDTFNKVSILAGTNVHIDFWEQVTAGDNFEFMSLLWKGDLPQLPIETPRLNGFLPLDFSDTITRIATIFDETASLPSNTTFTRIETVHGSIVALQSERITIRVLLGQASPVTQELEQSFQRLSQISQELGLTTVPATQPGALQVGQLQTYAEQLKKYFEIVIIPNGPLNLYQVYLQVENLASQSSPVATELDSRFRDMLQIQTNIGATGIVPDQAPSPLSASILQGYIQQLLDHLTSAADLHIWKQNVHTKTRNTLAEFRYYFFVGLPLLVDELNNWFFYYLNAQADPGIRSFMRAHWEENLPAANVIATSTMAQVAARRISMLTKNNVTTGVAEAQYINPYPEFDANIEKVP